MGLSSNKKVETETEILVSLGKHVIFFIMREAIGKALFPEIGHLRLQITNLILHR